MNTDKNVVDEVTSPQEAWSVRSRSLAYLP